MNFHLWLLRLIHILLLLLKYFQRLRSNITIGLRSWAGGKPTLMQQLPATLVKKPSHVGIIILEDKICYTDLANIIVWSREYGISFITLYSPIGSPGIDAALLTLALDQAAAHGCAGHYVIRAVDYRGEKGAAVCRHKRADEGLSGVPLVPPANSCCRSNETQVLLLPWHDGGRGLLVTAAQSSARALARRRRLSGTSTNFSNDTTPESLLDNELKGRLPVPCPEAILLFGGVPSLCGYLPWHVRLTEIFFISSHLGVAHQEFLHAMRLYGSTQQRLGT